MSFQIATGLSSFADKYEAFILDLWGVVHDGTKPYPGALDCMAKLREGGRPLLLLSNAPRTNDFVSEFLVSIGVPEDSYDHLLTSGDMTHYILKDGTHEFLQGRGKNFYQIGAEKDRGVDAGLDYTRVYELDEADFIVCTGLVNDDVETPDEYRELLIRAAGLDLPMFCANPDLTVMKGDKILYCAGALAALFEELGGKVELFGKPYPWAYKLAMEQLGVTDPSKILAVGDSMRTDIKGATGMGMHNVLVSGGIHAEEWGLAPGERPTEGQVEDVSEAHGFKPTYVVGHMTW
ncbi:TIGR01459 family HAD-type hydrolase [Sneathiella chinensis]|uniref:Haloacid dehalogenase n=1 Tax=Sneathiella chinensis TaxID=349750 RepID=A0ABQ5U2X5_9PROT|nr:TIGR01459 family HAD-type hydrolase [Sneathiella chinensis]GLQ05634.1 haloacid dehalogenase [Sneathiella chinensis]